MHDDLGERLASAERFCLDEIRYYTLWSRINRTTHILLQVAALTMAAFVPLLILARPQDSVRTAILSTVAWIASTLNQGFAFWENGNRKALAKVTLLLELMAFRTRSGKYNAITDPQQAVSTFTEQVTEIIKGSAKKWEGMVEKSGREFEKKFAEAAKRS